MVLDIVHKQAIAYMLEGRSISDVARLCNVSRASIYNWMKDKTFKAELDKERECLKTDINRKIANRSEVYIEQMHRIATTSKSDKERRAACEYLLDRFLGKSTTKVEGIDKDNGDDDKKVVDIEAMLKNIG